MSEPSADTLGTLYIKWLFKPDAADKLVEDIYTNTLPIALLTALPGTRGRGGSPRA